LQTKVDLVFVAHVPHCECIPSVFAETQPQCVYTSSQGVQIGHTIFPHILTSQNMAISTLGHSIGAISGVSVWAGVCLLVWQRKSSYSTTGIVLICFNKWATFL